MTSRHRSSSQRNPSLQNRQRLRQSGIQKHHAYFSPTNLKRNHFFKLFNIYPLFSIISEIFLFLIMEICLGEFCLFKAFKPYFNICIIINRYNCWFNDIICKNKGKIMIQGLVAKKIIDSIVKKVMDNRELKKIKEVSEIKMVGDSRVDFEYSTYMVSLMGIDSVECTYTDISVQRGVSGLEERVVSSLQDVGISKT